MGLAVEMFELRDATQIEAASAQIERANVQTLFVGQGPTLLSGRAEITSMVARLRLPAIYGFREFTEVGGLMSFGPSLPDVYRQSARLVDKILKGTSPADLPFEQPTRFLLAINKKTLEVLGLTISGAMLMRADEVVE